MSGSGWGASVGGGETSCPQSTPGSQVQVHGGILHGSVNAGGRDGGAYCGPLEPVPASEGVVLWRALLIDIYGDGASKWKKMEVVRNSAEDSVRPPREYAQRFAAFLTTEQENPSASRERRAGSNRAHKLGVFAAALPSSSGSVDVSGKSLRREPPALEATGGHGPVGG